MANKKTVVQMYEEILALPGLNDEQKAFIAKRIEITKKKNVLCKELEQDIIRNCPIAGDILSDETILKNRLELSDTEAEVKNRSD